MASFPYMSNPSRVKEFIQAIPGMGIPGKVTMQFIESVGYKSSNDRPILTILKTLGFIDSAGVPTETWRNYRNKSQSGAVMAAALRTTYKGLFTTFPDANRKDNEALRNYFSSHTTVGEGALKYMVSTFKSLVELADFGAAPLEPVDQDDGDEDQEGELPAPRRDRTKFMGTGGGGVTININIQLQIPDTDKAETYDNFFAALKKHLLS
jgi:hypothetical protein